jgi:drug/metabolite transporter (DMT)-like permease
LLAQFDFRSGATFGWGEALTLVASVLFAVQILLLDRVGRQVQSAHLTISFLSGTGVLALVSAFVRAEIGPGATAWLLWTGSLLQSWQVVEALALLTLLSTVLGFHWMNIYQPRVAAGRAALIYLLEPIFAALFSCLFRYDTLSSRLFLGGGLILFGNLLAEFPVWMRELKNNSAV